MNDRDGREVERPLFCRGPTFAYGRCQSDVLRDEVVACCVTLPPLQTRPGQSAVQPARPVRLVLVWASLFRKPRWHPTREPFGAARHRRVWGELHPGYRVPLKISKTYLLKMSMHNLPVDSFIITRCYIQDF